MATATPSRRYCKYVLQGVFLLYLRRFQFQEYHDILPLAMVTYRRGVSHWRVRGAGNSLLPIHLHLLRLQHRSSTIYPCDITDYGDIGPVRFEEPHVGATRSTLPAPSHLLEHQVTHVSLPWRYHPWRLDDYISMISGNPKL